MKLPGKDLLKKAFLVAAAGVGLGALGGCAVVPYGPHGRLIVEPIVPVAPVYVEPYPVYPVYPVYRGPVIVVPGHGGYHHGWHR